MTDPYVSVPRASGLGGTDAAAILGMSPYRSAFDVWAEKKSGVLDSVIDETNERMQWGTRLEKLIVEGYSEVTKRPHEWLNVTYRHPKREWHIFTPDAVCTEESRGIDAKNRGVDQVHEWGPAGTDEVPESVAVQAHYYMAGMDRDYWDIAVLFGGNQFRIYPIRRDPEVEGLILEQVERFWVDHIVGDRQPDIEDTQRARQYLAKKFPKNNGQLRDPTDEERELLMEFRRVRGEFSRMKVEKCNMEARIKLAIGDLDGFMWDGHKVTYKRSKDGKEVNWEAIARPLLDQQPRDIAETLLGLQTRPVPGSRRMYVRFKGEVEGEE